MTEKKKVLDSIWFHEMGSPNTIGIVKVDTGFGIKHYIGTATGQDQGEDEIKIMDGGAKFPRKAAEKIFGDDGDGMD